MKQAEEREQIKKQKAEAREAERRHKVGLKLANRENCSSRRSVVEDGLQQAYINSMCAACFQLYEDDVADGPRLKSGFMQCTENSCRKWMHVSCLDTDGEMYIC